MGGAPMTVLSRHSRVLEPKRHGITAPQRVRQVPPRLIKEYVYTLHVEVSIYVADGVVGLG